MSGAEVQRAEEQPAHGDTGTDLELRCCTRASAAVRVGARCSPSRWCRQCRCCGKVLPQTNPQEPTDTRVPGTSPFLLTEGTWSSR